MKITKIHLFILFTIILSVIIIFFSCSLFTTMTEDEWIEKFIGIVDPTITANFITDATEDGTVHSDGTTDSTNSSIPVGTNTGGSATMRGFLSFDTSAIPANAAITSAYLKIYMFKINSDPWLGNTCYIDIKSSNGGFSNNPLIQASDFGAASDQSSISIISKQTVQGQYYQSTGFNSLGLSAIAKGTNAKTQLRIKFDVSPAAGNSFSIGAGNYTYPSILVVKYVIE